VGSAIGEAGDCVVVAADLHPDTRVRLLERPHDRGGVLRGGAPGEPHSQRRHFPAHRTDRLGEDGDHPVRVWQEAAAGRGELDRSSVAEDERGPHQSLQPGDRPAESGLGELESLRGAGEVALLGDRDERPQVSQLDPVLRRHPCHAREA
jgi:hypothetical protein